MNKVITIDEALSHVKDGMSIMVGGFMGCGSPHKIIDAIVKKGVKDITLICNDTGFIDYGVGKWIANKQIKHLIATHIGMNRETGNQMNAGEITVELVPQGTLAERIRCGGNGLGGFYTPTGIGSDVVEKGKEKKVINGVEYILELPLRADLALVAGYKVDKMGNMTYRGSTRNFNVPMASAADLVICEAEQIVEIGDIDQNDVITPGIFVDYIVEGGEW